MSGAAAQKLLSPQNIQKGLQLAGTIGSLFPQTASSPPQQGLPPQQGSPLPPIQSQPFQLPTQPFFPQQLPQTMSQNGGSYGLSNAFKTIAINQTRAISGRLLFVIYPAFLLIFGIISSILAAWLPSFSDYDQNSGLKALRNGYIAMAVISFIQLAFSIPIIIAGQIWATFATFFGYIGVVISIIFVINFLVFFSLSIASLIIISKSAEYESGGGRGSYNSAAALLAFSILALLIYGAYGIFQFFSTRSKGGVKGEISDTIEATKFAAQFLV
jgi:hypothetical protein